MIVSTVRLLLPKTDRAQVIVSLVPLIGQTRAQPGCLACRLLTGMEDPKALILSETWDLQGNLDHHLRSDDYRRVLAVIDLSKEPPEIRFDYVESRGGMEIIEAARLPTFIAMHVETGTHPEQIQERVGHGDFRLTRDLCGKIVGSMVLSAEQTGRLDAATARALPDVGKHLVNMSIQKGENRAGAAENTTSPEMAVSA